MGDSHISPTPLQKARALLTGEARGAARSLLEGAVADPANGLEARFELARLAYDEGDWPEALAELEIVLTARPSDLGVWIEVARLARHHPASAKRLKGAPFPPDAKAVLSAVQSAVGPRLPRPKGELAKRAGAIDADLRATNPKAALLKLQGLAAPMPPVLRLLQAEAFLMSGAGQKAEALCGQLLREAPFCVEVLSLLSRLQLLKKQPTAALQAAFRAAELGSKDAGLVRIALLQALERGHIPAARRMLAEAKRCRAPRGQLTMVEAQVLLADGYPRQAAAVLRGKAKTAAAFELLAQCEARTGNSAAALAAYDKALAFRWTSDLATARAQVLQTNGEPADKALVEILTRAPGHGAAARAYAYGGKRSMDDPVITQIKSAIPDFPDQARLLHYALGKVAFDCKDIASVFPHLDAANAATAQLFPHGAEADRSLADRLMGPVTEGLSAVSSNGPDDVAPIFVTGMPRSGTTLVEQIIAAHSRVTAGGELSVANPALAPLLDQLEYGPAPSSTDWERGAQTYQERALERLPLEVLQNGGRYTDKSINSFTSLGPLQKMLPKASIVVVHRDPRDVAFSIYRNHFVDGKQRYSTSLHDIAGHYALYHRFIQHWKDSGVRFFEISYEALVTDPEPQARALLEACGLPWEAACLDFHLKKSRIETLSFSQARAPINTGSKGGWRAYEEQLAPFTNRARELGVPIPE